MPIGLFTKQKLAKLVELSLGKISGLGFNFQRLHRDLIKKPLINNQIRAEKVRLVDENGRQVGILTLEEALQMAKERNLDLIQVTEKVEPPVCKMMEYGKYLYWLQKKERTKSKKGRLKAIRFGFNISFRDLEIKAHQAENFLKKGNRVKIEMILRGREKGFSELAKEKIKKFLEILEKLIPIKIEGELKRESRGFTMIISKAR